MRTALSFADLPDIDNVAPLGDSDQQCLSEIAAVLRRHGLESRFGVALLHTHFEVGADEVLVESVDVAQRTLTTTPRPRSDSRSAIETLWRFDSPTAARQCETLCQTERDVEGELYHRTNHYTTS